MRRPGGSQVSSGGVVHPAKGTKAPRFSHGVEHHVPPDDEALVRAGLSARAQHLHQVGDDGAAGSARRQVALDGRQGRAGELSLRELGELRVVQVAHRSPLLAASATKRFRLSSKPAASHRATVARLTWESGASSSMEAPSTRFSLSSARSRGDSAARTRGVTNASKHRSASDRWRKEPHASTTPASSAAGGFDENSLNQELEQRFRRPLRDAVTLRAYLATNPIIEADELTFLLDFVWRTRDRGLAQVILEAAPSAPLGKHLRELVSGVGLTATLMSTFWIEMGALGRLSDEERNAVTLAAKDDDVLGLIRHHVEASAYMIENRRRRQRARE